MAKTRHELSEEQQKMIWEFRDKFPVQVSGIIYYNRTEAMQNFINEYPKYHQAIAEIDTRLSQKLEDFVMYAQNAINKEIPISNLYCVFEVLHNDVVIKIQ
ncbi:hypothetical protein [Seleniivibrio woodruffii]|uniref:hypothetical protein n=1 Tax=Seleniivibrio woodruffii TaxID=1078050 RepID=UPI00240A9192|nr:hypothetical protein [Seleniivibrio woodruffii]